MPHSLFNASVRAFQKEICLPSRMFRVRHSLASLKNQSGDYANSHRALIIFYEDIAKVIADHGGEE